VISRVTHQYQKQQDPCPGNCRASRSASSRKAVAGDGVTDENGRPVGFAPPLVQWKPWELVQMVVGDLPPLQSILGDGMEASQALRRDYTLL
jgi:hypothetical protein